MDFNTDNFNLNFNNYDIEDIQVEETINVVMVVDVSPSTRKYIGDLNLAFNDFIQTMQASQQVKDKMFVSVVEFDESVRVRSGFQPIIGVPAINFVPNGHGTALYDAVNAGIKNAVDYRELLEDSGVIVKTLVFVLTDGEDNSSARGAAKNVKDTLDKIKSIEANTFSFTTMMFGIGNSSSFEQAKIDMGIDLLCQVGQTGSDMKKLISFISSSVSKSASGANPADISF